MTEIIDEENLKRLKTVFDERDRKNEELMEANRQILKPLQQKRDEVLSTLEGVARISFLLEYYNKIVNMYGKKNYTKTFNDVKEMTLEKAEAYLKRAIDFVEQMFIRKDNKAADFNLLFNTGYLDKTGMQKLSQDEKTDFIRFVKRMILSGNHSLKDKRVQELIKEIEDSEEIDVQAFKHTAFEISFDRKTPIEEVDYEYTEEDKELIKEAREERKDYEKFKQLLKWQ